MKQIRAIILVIFSILFLTIFVSNKCLAAGSSDYIDIKPKSSVIPVDKVFTIRFNNTLKKSTVSNSNILVLDEGSNSVNVNVEIGDDNKSVLVSPINNYQYEKSYTLIIKKEVQSSEGKSLLKAVRMIFTTESKISSPITITIDAGHGGYDSGAVGPTGVLEKNITLPIAMKVGEILSKSGINVVYTRVSDTVDWPSNEGEDLQKRCDISDKANADYFIAIHANSVDDSRVNGLETFYFEGSSKGEKLAQSVEQELVQVSGLKDRGIKTERYYVLKNTNAVAILTEVGFISNPEQEKALNTSEYQNKYAEAIAKGILRYLGIES